MNEKMQEFINSIGSLTEVWVITYRQFISLGFSEQAALAHTQVFMSTMLNVILKNK